MCIEEWFSIKHGYGCFLFKTLCNKYWIWRNKQESRMTEHWMLFIHIFQSYSRISTVQIAQTVSQICGSKLHFSHTDRNSSFVNLQAYFDMHEYEINSRSMYLLRSRFRIWQPVNLTWTRKCIFLSFHGNPFLERYHARDENMTISAECQLFLRPMRSISLM